MLKYSLHFCCRSSVASAAIAQAQWSNVSVEIFLSCVVVIYFQTKKSGNEGGHQQVIIVNNNNFIGFGYNCVCARAYMHAH